MEFTGPKMLRVRTHFCGSETRQKPIKQSKPVHAANVCLQCNLSSVYRSLPMPSLVVSGFKQTAHKDKAGVSLQLCAPVPLAAQFSIEACQP